MSIVWLGIGLALAGFAMTGPLRWAMAVVIFFLPFGATQVFSTGGNPVLLPLVVALGFLARQAFALFVRPARLQFFQLLRSDGPLIAFLAYVVISGMFFPRLFDGATYVTPQVGFRPVTLSPELISYPQIAYVLIAALLYLALRQAILRVGLAPALYAMLAQVTFVAGIGLIQAVLGIVNVRVPMDWIVNAEGYSLITGSFEAGFARVNSVFPEASAFGTWGSGAIAFCYALYLNRIFPITSLSLAGVLGAAMLLSTSSTAYAGLALVAAFATVHAVFDNDSRRRDRGLIIVVAGAMIATIAGIVVLTSNSGFLASFRDMIEQFTLGKSSSSSSIERGQWAERSYQNAWDTAMLGVGYGAARSSGLFASIIGLMGVPGLLLFLTLVAPRIMAAFRRPRTGEDAVVCAAAFGLFGAIGAMALVSPDISISSPLWLFLPIAAAPLAQRAALRAVGELRAARDGAASTA